ncbi:MAG TPA: hypothetical protein PLJ98_07715, partial [Acholeplasmataceae bacterium]|nr:hypothetical protein [Acholeplasmataceae bacterium]
MGKVFKVLAIPYQIWLYVLVFVPLIAMVLIASSNYDSSISLNQINVSLNHWSILFQSQNVIAFRNSVVFAILTTLISFVLGYFAAYHIFQSKFKNK